MQPLEGTKANKAVSVLLCLNDHAIRASMTAEHVRRFRAWQERPEGQAAGDAALPATTA
jgi:hypothetical protein